MVGCARLGIFTRQLVSVGCGFNCRSALGLVAGYLGIEAGKCDRHFGRYFVSFSSILLAIGVVPSPAELQSVIIAVSLVQIPIYIRLTRSMVLSLGNKICFSCQGLGASELRIIFRHICREVSRLWYKQLFRMVQRTRSCRFGFLVWAHSRRF